jgi:MFS superfamily sulfate permease-like transporter
MLLNLIPLGVLAAILLVVGYKLAKPALFKKMYKEGLGQFMPFVVTILGIVFTDLLMGIGFRLVVAVFVILKNNINSPIRLSKNKKEGSHHYKMHLSEDVTFLNKASILKALKEIPNDSTLEINASNTRFIHFDVLEIIEDFKINAKTRNIDVTTINLDKNKEEMPIQHFKIEEEEDIKNYLATSIKAGCSVFFCSSFSDK